MLETVIRLIADGAVIPVVIIGSVALLWGVPNEKKLASYSRVLLAGLTAYFLARLIGHFYQPSTLRPFEELGVDPGALYLNNPGFPSDHMLFVTAIICAVWFQTRMKKTTLVLVVLALLVGVGRVVALVHTPLDVIGGVIIALIGAVWYIKLPPSKKTAVAKKEVPRGKTRRR